MAIVLMLVAHLLTLPAAFGQQQFDPSSYLQNKYGEASPPLTQAAVMIHGIPFLAFRSPAGNLYVPSIQGMTKDSIERALCANQIPQLLEKCALGDGPCQERNKQKMETEVVVVRAEAQLSENVKAYSEILTNTILKRCGDAQVTYFAGIKLKPEVGIEYKNGHQRDPTTYKVYSPGLLPQLGFKSEF